MAAILTGCSPSSVPDIQEIISRLEDSQVTELQDQSDEPTLIDLKESIDYEMQTKYGRLVIKGFDSTAKFKNGLTALKGVQEDFEDIFQINLQTRGNVVFSMQGDPENLEKIMQDFDGSKPLNSGMNK